MRIFDGEALSIVGVIKNIKQDISCMAGGKATIVEDASDVKLYPYFI